MLQLLSFNFNKGEPVTKNQNNNIPNVSRPFFVNLLESGAIPFKKVGAHRRVLSKDVLAYKAKNEQDRLDVLEKLAEDAQKNNMGYE